MPTITKKELIDRIVESTNTKRITVKTTIQNFLDEIAAELAKNNSLEFRDFVFLSPGRVRPRRDKIQRPWSEFKYQLSEQWSLK